MSTENISPETTGSSKHEEEPTLILKIEGVLKSPEPSNSLKPIITNGTFLILGALIAFVPPYLNQKNEVDKFKDQRNDQYRLTAIEQRLKVHQEVYSLSIDVIRANGNPDKLMYLQNKLDQIFTHKSLYLDDISRKRLVSLLAPLMSYNRNYKKDHNYKIDMTDLSKKANELSDALVDGVHLKPEKRDSIVRGI